MNTTDDKGSRIDRIREHHPFLHPGWVRAMLCHQSKLAVSDPTIGGNNDALQIRLECFVDLMTRMSEHEVRNELAKVQEHFVELDPDEFMNAEEAEAYNDYLKKK